MSDENSKAFTLPCDKVTYPSQQETRSLESLNTIYSWAIISAVRRRFTGEYKCCLVVNMLIQVNKKPDL